MVEREREGALDNQTRADLKIAYETQSTYWLKALLIQAIRAGASKEEVLNYLSELGMAPGNVKDLGRDIDAAHRLSEVPVARPYSQNEPSVPTWVGLAFAGAMVLLALAIVAVGGWFIFTQML